MEQVNEVKTQVSSVMFSVFDKKALAYLPPIFQKNKATAMRSLQQVVNDENHQFCKFSSDYELYEIGGFCEDTGIVLAYSKPKIVCNLEELKE